MGMQNNGPVAFPADRDSSRESASSRTSGLRVIMALMSELKCSMRAMKELTMARQVVTPENRELWREEIVASRTSMGRAWAEVIDVNEMRESNIVVSACILAVDGGLPASRGVVGCEGDG
jgi:hypothetical protein